jgi:hypothetical protein
VYLTNAARPKIAIPHQDKKKQYTSITHQNSRDQEQKNTLFESHNSMITISENNNIDNRASGYYMGYCLSSEMDLQSEEKVATV